MSTSPPKSPSHTHWIFVQALFVVVFSFLSAPLWAPFLPAGEQLEKQSILFQDDMTDTMILDYELKIFMGLRAAPERVPNVPESALEGQLKQLRETLQSLKSRGETLGGAARRVVLLHALEANNIEPQIAHLKSMLEEAREDEAEGADAEETDAESEPAWIATVLSIYEDGEAVTDEEIEQLKSELGFYGQVAEIHNARLKGEESPAAVKGVEDESFGFLVAYFIAFGTLLTVGCLGFVLLLTFLMLARSDRLTERFPKVIGLTPSGKVLFECFTLYLGFMLAASVFSGWVVEKGLLPDSLNARMLWSLVVQASGLVVVLTPLLYGYSKAQVKLAIGWKGPAQEIFLGPLGYCAILPLAGLAAMLGLQVAQALGIELSQGAHPITPVLGEARDSAFVVIAIFIMAVILAPLIEEIFFRGILYAGLRHRLGAMGSIAVSAAIFAAIHPQGIIGFFPLFMIGAGLAVLREWRDSIIAPIVAHACVNGVTLTIVWLTS